MRIPGAHPRRKKLDRRFTARSLRRGMDAALEKRGLTAKSWQQQNQEGATALSA